MLPGDFVQRGGDGALHVVALVFEVEVEDSQREENEPSPRLSGSKETDDEQFHTKQRPKNQLGAQRPSTFETAVNVASSLMQIFRDGCEAKAAPAIP